jgi:DNA-binding transcriptional MerR regulator
MIEKNNINHRKKMAQLRYKDEILRLNRNGLSLSEITKFINGKLAHTKLNVKLSRSTIYKVIKKYTKEKKEKNG